VAPFARFPRVHRMSNPGIRVVALCGVLAVAAVGALVVVMRQPDAGDGATTPIPHALPPPPVAAVAPQPAPRDAAVDAALDARPPEPPEPPVETLWPVAGSGDLASLTPRGPFAALEDLCKARQKSGDDCKVSPQDVESGPFPQIGTVEIFDAADPTIPVAPDSTQYVAVKGVAGWYVMPFAKLMTLHETAFFVTPQPAADALIIEYRKTEGNRWSNDTEVGITVCKPVDGSVACTPQIPLRKHGVVINSPQNPTVHVSVALACVATYADGAVTVTAMRRPADVDPYSDWDAAAAVRCKALPYAGKHRLAGSASH
jgi:hypothetical protein